MLKISTSELTVTNSDCCVRLNVSHTSIIYTEFLTLSIYTAYYSACYGVTKSQRGANSHHKLSWSDIS